LWGSANLWEASGAAFVATLLPRRGRFGEVWRPVSLGHCRIPCEGMRPRLQPAPHPAGPLG
jgi:hypothetical protein